MTFRTSAVRAALAITIGAAALGVAACTAPGTAKQTAAPQAGTSDIDEKPREQLKPGGTLRLSIQQWISQYNVGQVDGTQGDGQDILALTQPELWFRDEHGSISRNPDVLASAEVTATSPRQVVTYRINPKATWSDGTPITWRDFETQWKTRNGSAKAFTVSSTAGYDLITGVAKGADDREVKVTFGTPHADWQALFDPLLPGSALDTPQKFNTGWIEKIPVWAGPWKIGSLDKTAQTITVVPNDKYWGVKPVLGSIIFRALDSSAITDAYLNKEIDQAPARTPETYKRLSGAPGTAIRIGSRWDETHLTLGDAGPLADVRVRQAISIGLDRAAIARAASTDLPFKLQPLGNHFFMPAQSGYRDNSADYGRFDPAKAKKLLDEAGWTSKSEGAPRVRNGKALTLTYIVNSGGSNDIPQLVQNLLGKIGIGVELKQVPRNEFFEKYVNTGTFDLVSFRNVDVLFPSDNLPTFRTGGEQNYGKVAAPEVDALLAKAAAETDPAAARDLYNKADALIWKNGHSVELFQTPQISAVRSGLANYGAWGLRSSHQYTETGWLK
ncbi:MAG: glutathione transport system substrate-binding protein [Cryptosporangiaceae bacterium]|nr:glutathione transport system substrate-binding protein [Cryptosporangiaceae bacterium]